MKELEKIEPLWKQVLDDWTDLKGKFTSDSIRFQGLKPYTSSRKEINECVLKYYESYKLYINRFDNSSSDFLMKELNEVKLIFMRDSKTRHTEVMMNYSFFDYDFAINPDNLRKLGRGVSPWALNSRGEMKSLDGTTGRAVFLDWDFCINHIRSQEPINGAEADFLAIALAKALYCRYLNDKVEQLPRKDKKTVNIISQNDIEGLQKQATSETISYFKEKCALQHSPKDLNPSLSQLREPIRSMISSIEKDIEIGDAEKALEECKGYLNVCFDEIQSIHLDSKGYRTNSLNDPASRMELVRDYCEFTFWYQFYLVITKGIDAIIMKGRSTGSSSNSNSHIERTEKPKYIARHYVLTYLFDVNAKGASLPIGNKKALESIGKHWKPVNWKGKGQFFLQEIQ